LRRDAGRRDPGSGPRPAFCTELMILYLATELAEAAPAEADEDEGIALEPMRLAEALAAIEDGRIVDAKSIAGVYWLAHRLER
jgi:hypothetical protein